jgi:hypothetical protein
MLMRLPFCGGQGCGGRNSVVRVRQVSMGRAKLFVILASCVFFSLTLGECLARAQVNTRLLLVSGSGVPGHPGFTFGAFHDLAMNANQQIVFRTTLQSPRTSLPAVVESHGISFSVIAFDGLVSPVSGELYESFGSPSINDSGAVTFTAGLRGGGEGAPTAAIVRIKSGSSDLVAANGSGAESFGEVFRAFSAPVIGSAGEVVFGARTAGASPHSGLYLWSSQGIHPVPLPKSFRLGPGDLLQPIFASHDEAVFVRQGVDIAAAQEQFFRAVAIRNFQQLSPAPKPSETVQVLIPRPKEKPVQMLLVLLQGDRADTALLVGDPSQPVVAQVSPGTGAADASLFAAIEGQAAGRRSGSVIFAGVPSGQPNNFGLFCFCGGQVTRLTTPVDFGLLLSSLNERPIDSLAGDGQGTVALIAPVGTQPGGNAIFVCNIP